MIFRDTLSHFAAFIKRSFLWLLHSGSAQMALFLAQIGWMDGGLLLGYLRWYHYYCLSTVRSTNDDNVNHNNQTLCFFSRTSLLFLQVWPISYFHEVWHLCQNAVIFQFGDWFEMRTVLWQDNTHLSMTIWQFMIRLKEFWNSYFIYGFFSTCHY